MSNKAKAHRLIVVSITILLILVSINVENKVNAKSIDIGDLIEFGKYNSEPILWRVIHMTDDGSPLLFSENILTLKPFDGAGVYHPYFDARNDNRDNRNLHGSNYWQDSNIRQWLNSSEQKINWIQNSPAAGNVSDSHNPYEQEKGFLADGNFLNLERQLILPINHKVLLADRDKEMRVGGTEIHNYDWFSAGILQNYEQSYYQNVTDYVFFLSVAELKQYIYDRDWSDWARPTAKAVEKSTYRSNPYAVRQLDVAANWHYWLRTPLASRTNSVRVAGSGSGYVDNNPAYNGTTGVRPALYLNMTIVNIGSGTGEKISPYRVTAISDNNDSDTNTRPSSWAVNEIETAKNYGLTTPKVLTSYQNPITREEFCELAVKLYEVLSGQQAQPAPSHTFTDTINPEILKAYNLGIVAGVGDGKFAPHNNVTREQIAVMFYRTMTVAKPNSTAPLQAAPTFTDSKQVASWASEAVIEMSARGIITGMGDGRFAPKGNATREQGIALVKRVYEQLR